MAMLFSLLEYFIENFYISWVEGTLVGKQLGPRSGYSWRNH